MSDVVSADSQLVFYKIPMPHSVNNAFVLSRGRFIKSGDARIFDARVDKWISERLHELKRPREIATQWLSSGCVLRVDVDFFFHRKRLFSVTKKADFVKSLDVNNRIKPLLDGVVKILGIDDKYFFDHFITKQACKDSELEFCNVTVTPIPASELMRRASVAVTK